MKVSITILLVIFNYFCAVAQWIDSINNKVAEDTMLIDTFLLNTDLTNSVDQEELKRINKLEIGFSHAQFKLNNSRQAQYNLQYSTQVNKKWSAQGLIALYQSREKNSKQYGVSIQHSFDKGGISLLIQKSDDILAPLSNQRLSYYRPLREDLIFNISISRFTSSTRRAVWPSFLSMTKVINRVGYSIELSHDISQLGYISPLGKISATYESERGNILNAYFVIGTTRQPNFLITSLAIESHQVGIGGWFKKHLSNHIALTGALGFTKISNNNGDAFQIINTNISITTKI